MRILFHKKRPGEDIENWPIFVLFKGLKTVCSVWREYLPGGFIMYKL